MKLNQKMNNMLTVYTANEYGLLRLTRTTYSWPEEKRSPQEQINWIKIRIKNLKGNESIKTFSPYILNYLNLALEKGDIKPEDLEVIEVIRCDDNVEEVSLKVKDDKGRCMIDTRSLSDPISEIYQEFNNLRKNGN